MGKRLTTICFFLFCSAGALGQGRPEPILVDEFDRSGCELFQSIMDTFFVGITEQQNAMGMIVIFGDSASINRSSEYEDWIRGYTHFRNFPKDKLTVLRRRSTSPKVQFWIVPAGASHQV